MGVEIERKYLVTGQQWRQSVRRSIEISQGYLSTEADHTVRVRLTDQQGFLTIKGRATELVRPEFEYEIPADDAGELLEGFCGGRVLEKVRHEVEVGDHVWEIDEFGGANRGLVVAEVELEDAGESFEVPTWIGEEVTGQVRYYNSRLVEKPFTTW